MATSAARLTELTQSKSAIVGVVGLGYVGLPVATSFARAGFRVVGVDTDSERIQVLNSGRSPVTDVEDATVAEFAERGRLRFSDSYDLLREADCVLISVPSPLKDGTPDLSLLLSAGRDVSRVLKDGALVVLESTTYPGTTEEALLPLLLEGRERKDFFLAYSPERIDPANRSYGFEDIPKVVGGVTEEDGELASLLYSQVVPKVVTLTGTREAELTKLVENTFRHVNIALVNELAVYAHDMEVDIWEVLEAAATKPFGFMPFWPGPGWGGHCIPLDPTYLSWRVRRDRAHEVRFVELAQAVNSEMPRYVVERAAILLNEAEKPLKRSTILLIGMAYKPGVNDIRESAPIKVMRSLSKRGASVEFHDPLVSEITMDDEVIRGVDLSPERLASTDLVMILNKQSHVDWQAIESSADLVFDCCNALGRPHSNGRTRL